VSIVVDTSVTLAWVFEDEGTPATEELLDRVCEEGGVVPSLWQYEVSNAVLTAVRRERLDKAAATHLLTLLGQLNLRVEQAGMDMARVLELAASSGLTAYDAAYLDVAMTLGVPLATLDNRLARAAEAVGVSVLPSTPTGRAL